MRMSNLEGIARMQCRHRRRTHRKEKFRKVICLLGLVLLIAVLCGLTNSKSENEKLSTDIKCGQAILLPGFGSIRINNVKIESNPPQIQYTSLNVPKINSSWKRWMDHKKTSNKNSPQYNFIKNYSWVDDMGFMRCNGERDLGINDDYYLIALGSYYGTTIGTKYRITTDTGNVFYGVLAECKADIHTNSTHQYTNKPNPDIVEFVIDEEKLNKDVKRMGSANVYMPLNGSIAKIERIDFITEVQCDE